MVVSIGFFQEKWSDMVSGRNIDFLIINAARFVVFREEVTF